MTHPFTHLVFTARRVESAGMRRGVERCKGHVQLRFKNSERRRRGAPVTRDKVPEEANVLQHFRHAEEGFSTAARARPLVPCDCDSLGK